MTSVRVWVAVAMMAGLGCGVRQSGAPMTAAEAEAVIRGVRAFGEDVAREVTQEGVGAWGRYFEEGPGFFMATDGKLEFASGMAAKTALPGIAIGIKKIELRWEGAMRVDALAPGMASVGAAYHEARVDAAGKRVEEDGYFTALGNSNFIKASIVFDELI